MKKTSNLFQTTTHVHNEQESVAQRKNAGKNGEGTLLALTIYAQLAVSLCYGLLYYLGTTAWQSVLLSAPVALAFVYLGRAAAGRGVPAWTLLPVLPALVLDSLLFLLALCDLSMDFLLPDMRRLFTAILICITLLLSLLSSGDAALSRLSRVLLPLLIAALLWSVLTSLSVARVGNLVPVLGKGIQPTLISTLIPIGCIWQAPLPILLDKRLGKEAPRSPLFALLAVGMGVLTGLVFALIWPMEALTEPLAPAKRMMLINETSASTLTWSLLAFSWLFLLLMALGASVRAFERVMRSVMPLKKYGWIYILLPLALIFWPASRATDQMVDLFLRISPYRAALMLLSLILSLIFGKRRKAA